MAKRIQCWEVARNKFEKKPKRQIEATTAIIYWYKIKKKKIGGEVIISKDHKMRKKGTCKIYC